MHRCSRRWARRLYPSNPSYVLSAVLVLYGLHVAFGDGDRLASGALLTGLFCGYALALAGVGILVIRLGALWEDARTILLLLLLLFAALSTSFDQLCLRDWRAGSWNLAAGFTFCVLATEWVLRAIRLRLPAVFRVPYYLILGVLFAFPPALGWYSLEGRERDMCRGVWFFCLAAGACVLALVPAAMTHRKRLTPKAARWPWPLYPWAIFVLMTVALAVRTWTLSLSFSPVKGLDSAFHPYLLAPACLAVAGVLLAIGLSCRSVATQRIAVLVSLLPPLLANPWVDFNRAQARLVEVVRETTGEPLILSIYGSLAFAVAAMLCRVAWAEWAAMAMVGAVVSLVRTPAR